MNVTLVEKEYEDISKYLSHILNVVNDLANINEIVVSKSAEGYLDHIARNLLFKVVDPCVLSQPAPESLIPKSDNTTVDANDLNVSFDQNISESKYRFIRRIDILRKLFRCMAPIAYDIGSRVVSIYLSSHHISDEGTKRIEYNNCSNIFILFAVWLPVAPQLSSLVSDLFQVKEIPCPFDIFMPSAIQKEHKEIVKNDISMDWDVCSDTKDVLTCMPIEQILILSEASHLLIKFFSNRGEHEEMKKWWSWAGLFGLLGVYNDTEESKDAKMDDIDESFTTSFDENKFDEMGWGNKDFDYCKAVRWHAARAVSHLMNLNEFSRYLYLKKLNLHEEIVPWVPHPWLLTDEEVDHQNNFLKGMYSIYRSNENHLVNAPSPLQIRKIVPTPTFYVDLSGGILLPRQDAISSLCQSFMNVSHMDRIVSESFKKSPNQESSRSLVMTPTTCHNLALLGSALNTDPYPPPILLCGPRGSGKSSLIRELANFCRLEPRYNNADSGVDNILELHVDEETDSKTLIGSYAATDIPGEFAWRPGALTNAVRQGKWVILEDVETFPLEIQSALVKLFKDRTLPISPGKNERCHPNFRIFGTYTTEQSSIVNHSEPRECSDRRQAVGGTGSGAKRIVNPELWRKVHIDPLPFNELNVVSIKLFPSVPAFVSNAALNVFRILDKSGRAEDVINEDSNISSLNLLSKYSYSFQGSGRHASVRDYIKLLSRISSSVHFEPGATFATESQRIICMAETTDVFVGWNPDANQRALFITSIAAKAWEISAEAALKYMNDRRPVITFSQEYVEIGRSTLFYPHLKDKEEGYFQERNFADTDYSLRYMETISVCVSRNEPILLVGETGCGKTTLIQRLASLSRNTLIVQNLSLQTDSTDLLGGYRPLEINHLARKMYIDFIELFVSCFSRSQNEQFINFVTTSYEKNQWKKLSQCFSRAATMGLKKYQEKESHGLNVSESTTFWLEFKQKADRFEKQRIACDSGLGFSFSEGALVDAIRKGKWVLLDEINLASSDTLQRLCGLLDDSTSSVTLTEKGDSEAIQRHPNFRLFAAMNPATDSGKKDLPSSLRSRFTEIYVDELVNPVELRSVAARYLSGTGAEDTKVGFSDTVITVVDVYLKCRKLSEEALVDGSGQKPRYTLRTLCRGLVAAKNLIKEQKFNMKRAILEGFELGFEGSLEESSREALKQLLSRHLGCGLTYKELNHPSRRPGGEDEFTLSKPFWLKTGTHQRRDWSEASSGRSKFVLTQSMAFNLRRLSRTVAAGPWPVLLEGPTSAGKTTLVEYLASLCGHRCVRINNHEHTDVQEYTGSYAADSNGKLCFREGILVQALRKGYWVILDELNLAPTEVLEALNRLLDDNRELYIPEINEVVKPHIDFRLFATQNPSGAYGGRKPLSRAFRNRFVEINIADIPEQEMIQILELRCGCPLSHAKLLVKVMSSLRKRRNKSSVFMGKDGLITPRDLLRWAERKVNTKLELAIEGYMLLAERLRNDDEKQVVLNVIEDHFKVNIDIENLYYGDDSDSRKILKKVIEMEDVFQEAGISLQAIAPTKSLLRLLTLVMRCIEQQEPVLLVGDTGCGKTTVVQLLSLILKRNMHIVNCHASTETSDLLGGLRPLRGRHLIYKELLMMSNKLFESLRQFNYPSSSILPDGDSEPRIDELQQIISFVGKVKKDILALDSNQCGSVAFESRQEKRRKLDSDENVLSQIEIGFRREIVEITIEIEKLYQKYMSLFEWIDGPLVQAMKTGSLLLLDEMSLAEDAVLERLNSVLEPSRTLVLAEKGGDLSDNKCDSNDTEIIAHADFRIFATMNPGGDFGKRELSPALRSRFTEIWVPAVKDLNDIDLVLERTISSLSKKYPCMKSEKMDKFSILRKSMLDYTEWFNQKICGNALSTLSEFTLSLRDVLAWATFVVDAYAKNGKINVWAVYMHGASLMHLDGLGMGTGLSREDVEKTRMEAKDFLKMQVPSSDLQSSAFGFENELENIDESNILRSKEYGVYPFFISVGSEEIPPEKSFKMSAPTTGMNLRRVLRAMQVSKPILLEGSPGVGKTSLISALATASGHRLVRINLSEQTDMSDLMGSDLPVPDASESQTSGASFRWCDGILLKAIKDGSWVLLDELNLASQTVLEGLNSCLDHRASVYIPELDTSFKCPPSFRIFGAQNPLIQGGGRKGLPRSFLNRFTKVYIEPLTSADMNGIIEERFPRINSCLIESMIKFNRQIENDIESGEYGQLGSPWEFNLRDLFRWCELIMKFHAYDNEKKCEEFKETIYCHRFRSIQDRMVIRQRYQHLFGLKRCNDIFPQIHLTDEYIQLGNAKLHRSTSLLGNMHNLCFFDNTALMRSYLRPMETVALCIEKNWPCLLVGPAASGKSSILKVLSQSTNMHLEEVALTPASDVSELLGCFEQTDVAEVEDTLLLSLKLIYEYACQTLIQGPAEVKCLQYITFFYHRITSTILKVRSRSQYSSFMLDSDLHHDILGYLENIRHGASLSKEFNVFNNQIQNLDDQINYVNAMNAKKTKDASAAHFRWIDGILVTAMEKGYWLHLKNVNFCPSSVLDRLNPLMENDGTLLLTECGITCKEKQLEAKPRVVIPHRNFRLFLSMDPTYGEVSRAMRNRCIEVSIFHPDISQIGFTKQQESSNIETLDGLDSLWNIGIRSSALAKEMMKNHYFEYERKVHNHHLSPTTLKEWGIMLKSSWDRGFPIQISMKNTFNLSYQMLNSEPITFQFIGSLGFERLVNAPVTSILVSNPSYSKVYHDARILRPFIFTEDMQLATGITCFSNEGSEEYQEYASSLEANDIRLPSVRKRLLYKFASKVSKVDTCERVMFLAGYDSRTYTEIKFMLSTILRKCDEIPDLIYNLQILPFDDGGTSSDISKLVKISLINRLTQMVTEYFFYKSLKQLHPEAAAFANLSAVALSFCLHESKLDRSQVSCPVTPIVFSFFDALDAVYYTLEHFVSTLAVSISDSDLKAIENMFISRDRLWLFLSQVKVRTQSSFLGFDETEFLVQWTWMKKSLDSFQLSCEKFDNDDEESLTSKFRSAKRRLDLCVLSIDKSIYNSSGDVRYLTDGIWKGSGHPLVPYSANDFEEINKLRILAKDCSLQNLDISTEVVSIDWLISREHPLLFIDIETKREILITLCMIHWATTNETELCTRYESMDFNTAKSVLRILGKINKMKDTMQKKLEDLIVTLDPNMPQNRIKDVNDLDNLQINSISSDNNHIIWEILTIHASIQTGQIFELWCVQEELWIVSYISGILTGSSSIDVQNLLVCFVPRVKKFIKTAYEKTTWSIHHLRSYQTIVWVCESTNLQNTALHRFFRCVFMTIMISSNQHKWSNTFINIQCVNNNLNGPSICGFLSSRQVENKPIFEDEGVHSTLLCGPPRLDQGVVTSLLFNLLGYNKNSNKRYSEVTLENYSIRRKQYEDIFSFLSADYQGIESEKRSCNYLHYMFSNAMSALTSFFPEKNDVIILLNRVKGVNQMDIDINIQTILSHCTHHKFQDMVKPVIHPIFELFHQLQHCYCEKSYAKAHIFVGLFCFHIFSPSSPVDPGRKPAAKMSQWDSYLSELSCQLTAQRMENGLETGNFSPWDQTSIEILDKASTARRKRTSQAKKRVQRPSSSPPFFELYRDVHHFAKTVASVENILSLISSFDNIDDVRGSLQKELNWQGSIEFFFNKMSSNYNAFDDIVAPLVASLGMLRDGMRMYASQLLKKVTLSQVNALEMQSNLLTYPNVSFLKEFDLCANKMSLDRKQDIPRTSSLLRIDETSKRCKVLYLLCQLSYLSIMKNEKLLNEEVVFLNASHIFGAIAQSWKILKNESTVTQIAESDEDRKEREFREQFPDHAKLFQKIIDEAEKRFEGNELDEENDSERDMDKVDIFFSDDEIHSVSQLHTEIYLSRCSPSYDASRIRAFLFGYEAASELNKVSQESFQNAIEKNSFVAHSFALGLKSPSDNIGILAVASQSSNIIDFHSDPNPKEAVKASLPLRSLHTRIIRLLHVFPGNHILMTTGELVETMLRFDLNNVSLGKMLTGIEVILRKAQDWEQHASSRVKLGEPLKDISRLISLWRKIELQSWSSLLDVRDKRQTVQAYRHWIRLYSLLILNIPDEEYEKVAIDDIEGRDMLHMCPVWVWKGMKEILDKKNYSLRSVEDFVDLIEMVKALDTFLLTSGIGQFHDRLQILASFSKQLFFECEHKRKNAKKVILASLVQSIWGHYSQFSSLILETKKARRAPIEKKLKDEVKLAKWDEQTYYSLAESSEKSHRKLMMLVQEYEEVLHINVGQILEENFIHGIRSNTNLSDNAASCEFPSNSTIFPLAEVDSISSSSIIEDNDKTTLGKDTNLAFSVGFDEELSFHDIDDNFGDKYIMNRRKYLAKIKRFSSEYSSIDSSGKIGSDISMDISDAIFERIESLRGKATKPMKQRALVDLFKALKGNGFSHMRWSVPSQLRNMSSILQLPCPKVTHILRENGKPLRESELYFRRSTIELSRLRSEIELLGSSYMSQREMQLMLGYCEHGMLMLCQQRCNLVENIAILTSLSDIVYGFGDIKDGVLSNQSSSEESVGKFEKSLKCSLESLHQLSLASKTFSNLVGDQEQHQMTDTISIIESCNQLLKPMNALIKPRLFITKATLNSIRNSIPEILNIIHDLKVCSLKCTKGRILLCNMIHTCLQHLQETHDYAIASISDPNDDHTTNPYDHEINTNIYSTISNLIQKSLIISQTLFNSPNRSEAEKDYGDNVETIWGLHRNILQEWNSMNISNLLSILHRLSFDLRSNSMTSNINMFEMNCKISGEACVLVLQVLKLCNNRINDAVSFYRNMAKLEYILLRIFRVLIAKGFCNSDAVDEEEGDGEGDASNMKFEDDVEGTGMGEGEGKNDVTDQIENEEQLLGLKNDSEKEDKNTNDQKQLNEEQAETGMEMEADFDGELYDVPDQKEAPEQDNDEEEEELDREMGDGYDPNEQVVDEKMWDDDEEDERKKEESEKFEKDSKLSGEAVQDELRTKEDDDDDDKKNGHTGEDLNQGDKEENKNESNMEDERNGVQDDDDDAINDDYEDDYEDKHVGVDVRSEENADEGEQDGNIDIDEEMNLDGDEGNESDKEANNAQNVIDEDEDSSIANEEDIDQPMNEDDEGDVDEEQAVNASNPNLNGDDQKMNVNDENDDEHTDVPDDEEVDESINDNNNNEHQNEAHGVAAANGVDTVKMQREEEEESNNNNEELKGEEQEKRGLGKEDENNSSNDNNDGSALDGGFDNGNDPDSVQIDEKNSNEVPNPFRDPGDAEKFWHKRLNMMNESDCAEDEQESDLNQQPENVDDIDSDMPQKGMYEFSRDFQSNTTQVLGEALEDKTSQLQRHEEETRNDEDEEDVGEDIKDDDAKMSDSSKKKSKALEKKSTEPKQLNTEDTQKSADQDNRNNSSDEEVDDNIVEEEEVNNDNQDDVNLSADDQPTENEVMTDLEQLNMREEDSELLPNENPDGIIETMGLTHLTYSDLEEARQKWAEIQSSTNSLSRRLCEKLRLVMEPLVATKLRGDYRTGKRINMKRVIGYIASGYRKDKIWLRRTKPAKRNYRVLLAVDDSESMKRGGAGDMAMAALATLANGMSQLEIGELGIASFGEDMKLIHPFHTPFTSSSGAHLVSSFQFDDKRTRTAFCVESALAALDSQAGTSASMQLVFIISDGRIERDSKSDLRRLVREMCERNILLVMIIVEGDNINQHNNGMKDSIINMKEVSFENGKPKVKHFIDDYPFPYYMVLRDMHTLPDVLGDALRQWFEMLAQTQR